MRTNRARARLEFSQIVENRRPSNPVQNAQLRLLLSPITQWPRPNPSFRGGVAAQDRVIVYVLTRDRLRTFPLCVWYKAGSNGHPFCNVE